MGRRLEHALIEDVDDRGVDARRRLRGERFAEEQRRAQVDGELAIEARNVERADLVLLEARRVVDQQRQRTDLRIRRRQKPGDRGVIGKIRPHHRGAPACARDLHRAALPHPATECRA